MAARNPILVLIAAVMAVTAATSLWRERNVDASLDPTNAGERSSQAAATDQIERAFRDRTSNVQVEGEGVVERLLADDNDGSRHQRFIVRLSTGRTLLIAHNIDLASRIGSLRQGDTIRFFGEYEWNDKGGVLHWTHHDPQGRHIAGWLEHAGRRYQ